MNSLRKSEAGRYGYPVVAWPVPFRWLPKRVEHAFAAGSGE